MKHVIQIRRNYGKPRKHRISDVDYNKMVGLITNTETYGGSPKHFRIYSSSPSALYAHIKDFVDGVQKWELKKKYIRLGFNSKNARDAALEQVEKLRGNKIIGYNANDPLLATTSNGSTVRLTSAMNAPSGGNPSPLLAPVNNENGNGSGGIDSKTLIIIAIVAVVAIAGFVIFMKKKK